MQFTSESIRNNKAKSIKKKSLEYLPLLLYYFYTLLLPVFLR